MRHFGFWLDYGRKAPGLSQLSTSRCKTQSLMARVRLEDHCGVQSLFLFVRFFQSRFNFVCSVTLRILYSMLSRLLVVFSCIAHSRPLSLHLPTASYPSYSSQGPKLYGKNPPLPSPAPPQVEETSARLAVAIISATIVVVVVAVVKEHVPSVVKVSPGTGPLLFSVVAPPQNIQLLIVEERDMRNTVGHLSSWCGIWIENEKGLVFPHVQSGEIDRRF